MRTAITNPGRSAYYTVRETAWILGVRPSRISRTIRLGTLRTERRRGRLMVPASVLTRLLPEPLGSPADSEANEQPESGQAYGHRPQFGAAP